MQRIRGNKKILGVADADDKFMRKCHGTSLLAGSCVLGAAIVVMFGWVFDLDILTRGVPGWPATHPLTAICCALIGLNLISTMLPLLKSNPPAKAYTSRRILTARLCGMTTLVICGLQTMMYLSESPRTLDVMLFPEWSSDASAQPSRMAFPTAIMLLFTAIAAIVPPPRNSARVWLQQGMLFAAGTVAILSLLGHAIGASFFYGYFTSILTATLVLTLVLGTSCVYPDRGWVRVYRGGGIAATMMIWLLPLGLLLPLATGLLHLSMRYQGIMDRESAVYMQVAVTTYLILFVTMIAASRVRDVEERILGATDLIERREADLSVTLLSIGDAVLATDRQGVIVRMNPVAEKLIGWRADEALGHPLGDILSLREEKSETPVRVLADDAATGELSDFPNPLELTARNGREIAVALTAAPIRDHARNVTGAVLVLRDVTAERIARKELEAFCYSVSHDLRAPLRHVQGYVQLLERAAGDALDEKAHRYLERVNKASTEMNTLIDDLLSFSRMGRVGMTELNLDLNALVRECIQYLEMDTRDRNIEWKIAALPRVKADPAMLRNVFTNLLGNAIKYTAPRDPARIEIGVDGEKGNQIIIFVRDNGVGFDPQYTGKLFGVFQRLHSSDEFEGTGIGLANVQRIIARHGGRVWATGEIGAGATFYFTLPKEGSHLDQKRTET